MEGLRFREELGVGAVATVYRLEDRAGQSYAGKVLHASRAGEADAMARFAREADVVRDVDNVHVVQVLGRQAVEGRDVLVMELVEGPTLQYVIAAEAPLPHARVVAIGIGILRGLAAAHDAGVVHRDLKPANILLAAGDVPKIADFGMARASSLAGVDRSALTVLGTPDYMAPESLDPLAVDARSDLYSVGCILFELVMGRPPFSGATSFAVLEQHRVAPIPAMPEVDAALASFIALLLQKNPADRVQSASGAVGMLEDLGSGGSVAVRNVGSDAGRCAECGAPLTPGLSICLSCRSAVPHVSDGDHTVFVTGPGEVAGKLDSALRARLVAWLQDNRALGIESSGLEKSIPRLPFALLTQVDEVGGRRLVGALATLGLEAEVVQGGVLALPSARSKARTLTGRVAGIIAVSFAGLINTFIENLWVMGPALVLALVVVPLATAGRTLRAKAKRTTGPAALPPALAKRLDSVATVAAGIESGRHRESLRAAVSRALAMRDATGADPRVDEETGSAIDQALVATGRLDTIDQQLRGVDLRAPDERAHALMHERDLWSARLHDLVGTLESLRVRLAAAAGRGGAADDTLAALKAKVDALEEVQNDV